MIGVFLGMLFGGALYLVGATKSENIKSMLGLKNIVLMKIIVFGIGFGSFLVSLAYFLGIFEISHLEIKPLHLGVVIGGIIFGVGFGIAGMCPGTCVASSGTNNVFKALFVVLGGLLGALAYTLSYEFWERVGLFDVWNVGEMSLFKLSDSFPSLLPFGFEGLAVFGVVMMIVAYLLPIIEERS